MKKEILVQCLLMWLLPKVKSGVGNRLKDFIEEINKIASWYRDNFFIEPTEGNIVKAFGLEKMDD